MITIGTAQLWVHDQDEALAFYTDQVGLRTPRRTSRVPEMGNFRWLTVRAPTQPGHRSGPDGDTGTPDHRRRIPRRRSCR